MVLMTLLAIAGMQNGVAAASWTGSITSFSASRTEVHANDRTATVTMSIDPSIYGTPYVMSIYDETNTLVRSCTYPYTSACSINSTPPNNGTKSYRAYVAQDAPTAGPPTVDVRASAGPVSVRNLGWLGSITSFSASRTEVHANDRTATVTMSIDPSIYGTPYVMSIYDETNTLVRSCTYPYTSACSINSTPPNNGTKSYRAYVAQDAPTTGPPTVDVRASSRAVFVSSMDVSVEVASLALAAPLMIDPCVELFPVGPASSPPSSLNELQKQCETARAAGTPWPTVIQNLVNGFGAGIVIAASVAAHDGGPQVGAPPRTSPNPAPPQAPPQSEPPAFDPAFINGGGARLLARTRVTGYEYIADPTPENSARKVFAQCVRLATWATSGITRADCETKPIFAPGYDVTEAAQHDFGVIWRAPRTVRLNALTREEKGNSGVLSGWYNRAPYDTPDLCPAPRPTSTDCDEYPFYSSREGGPDAGGPGTLLPQQLRIIDRGQNQLEGRLLGAFYTVCGVTDPPQGSPQREYLVVPMPVQTQIPTTGYCKGG